MLIAMMGIDGCGKTTQAAMVRKFLSDKGIAVFESKAYSRITKPIVDPLLDTWDNTSINFLFEALYTQQRVEAERAIREGNVVVADRWDESYLAYHCLHGPLSKDRAFREAMNHYAFQNVWPDLGFMFILEPEIAKQRACERDCSGRVDKREIGYFTEIQEEYLKLAERRGYVTIPVVGTAEYVHTLVVAHLAERL